MASKSTSPKQTWNHDMDTTTTTHISLCTGYGGIDLGLKRVIRGLRTVAACEIEAFAIANLVAKMESGLMDAAPVWPDVKTFPWGAFRDRVDILTSGYPCQPFSAAGQRRGKDDPRHLWPWIADGIRLLRPRCCFFENVEGHISLGLPDVIEDLAGLGYRATWGIFSAAEVGAPHQRKRVFILAYRDGERGQLPAWWRVAAEQVPVGHGKAGRDELADGQREHDGWLQREGKLREQQEGGSCGQRVVATGDQAWPSRPGEQQYWWEPPRVVGDSHRIDRSAPAEGREHDRQAGSAGEELGNADHGRLAPSLDAGSGAEADRGGQGHVEQADGGASGGVGNAADARRNYSDKQDNWTQLPCKRFDDIRETAFSETQPPLGGDADGPAGGLGYAELCVSCDNRTDELRLLGNGVVPATAALAFRTLMDRFL